MIFLFFLSCLQLYVSCRMSSNALGGLAYRAIIRTANPTLYAWLRLSKCSKLRLLSLYF